MSENQRMRAHVSGHVQGVGFRYFTLMTGQRLQLTGWVRNLADGGVETLAEGPKEDLISFLEALWEGPGGAHVRDVRTQWLPATGEFSGFRIW